MNMFHRPLRTGSTMPSTSATMRTPSRRMTLASVPSQQVNCQSVGERPSDVGTANKARRPPSGRVSMIPRVGRENQVPPSPAHSARGVPSTASSRRRSSIGGAALHSERRAPALPPNAPVVKADPRPINDKVFQQQCIHQLYNFLSNNGYDHPISLNTLSRPSAKDFNSICTFMLRMVDANFQTGTMKFEDEVVLNFKCLGYPYTMSKTSLVAAGSPHTWPALLSTLTWLMEHLQCLQAHLPDDLEDDQPFETVQDLHFRTDKIFFEYVGKAYMAFLRQEKTDHLEAALADRFDRDDSYLIQEIERVTDLNASIVERINVLNREAQDLPILAKKREEYATDLEQFHDLIRQMDDHKAALEKKVQERSSELAETNKRLEKMTLHIEDLKRTVATQVMSVNDLQKMESEIKGLAESMDRTIALKEQRRKVLLSCEKELMSVRHSLDALIADYGTSLAEALDFPALSKSLSNFTVKLHPKISLNSSQAEMMGIDLRGKVLPALEESTQNYNAEVNKAKAAHQDDLDTIERMELACNEAEAKLKIVVDKETKCEQTFESEKVTHDAKLSVRQREVDALEGKIAARRDPMALEEQMAAFERQCAELEALHMEHQEQNVAKKKAIIDEIAEACRLMHEHDEYFRQKLVELDEYWAKKEEQIGRVSLPANVEITDH